MGAPFTLPGYDAWKLTPPWDQPKRRPASNTVTTTLCIETADVTIDAYATYSADSGELVSVRVNGREMPPHVIEAFVGDHALGSELDALPDDDLGSLIEAQLADEAADRADHEYHRCRDYGEH